MFPVWGLSLDGFLISGTDYVFPIWCGEGREGGSSSNPMVANFLFSLYEICAQNQWTSEDMKFWDLIRGLRNWPPEFDYHFNSCWMRGGGLEQKVEQLSLRPTDIVYWLCLRVTMLEITSSIPVDRQFYNAVFTKFVFRRSGVIKCCGPGWGFQHWWSELHYR